MVKKLSLALLISIFIFVPYAFADIYDIDPVHTTIEFSVKHMVISNVKGVFDDFSGYFEVDDKGKVLDIKIAMKAASINTRNEKRDKHLRSPDFLDVKQFEELTFTYKKILSHEGNIYQILGDLTIRGVTKEVVLDCEYYGKVKDPWGNTRAGLTASTKINRKDFGLTWNKLLETGALVVGNVIKIQLEIESILRVDKKGKTKGTEKK